MKKWDVVHWSAFGCYVVFKQKKQTNKVFNWSCRWPRQCLGVSPPPCWRCSWTPSCRPMPAFLWWGQASQRTGCPSSPAQKTLPSCLLSSPGTAPITSCVPERIWRFTSAPLAWFSANARSFVIGQRSVTSGDVLGILTVKTFCNNLLFTNITATVCVRGHPGTPQWKFFVFVFKQESLRVVFVLPDTSFC